MHRKCRNKLNTHAIDGADFNAQLYTRSTADHSCPVFPVTPQNHAYTKDQPGQQEHLLVNTAVPATAQ